MAMAMEFSKNSLLLPSAPIGLQQPVCQYGWHTKETTLLRTGKHTGQDTSSQPMGTRDLCPDTSFGSLHGYSLKNYSLDLDCSRVRTGHH